MGGIKKTRTVLFTDLVGSTEIATRLGPDRAEALRSRHFAELRAALAVHRGTEVKTLGDGFMAVFESAGDGLACAVTMQRAVAREGDVAIRIGVSAGDVTESERDFFGVAAIEASRLCAAARADQILVAEIAAQLAGKSEIHHWMELDAIDLKGLPGPTQVRELRWEEGEDFALRVALADDTPLLRKGIAQMLEDQGMQVVLEADDGDQLLEKLPAARPHVAIIDMRMPPTQTTEGLEAAERIRADHPGIGVLVLSADLQPGAARRLLAGGSEGVGYMLKDRVADVAELGTAIRSVASGGSAIDRDLADRVGVA